MNVLGTRHVVESAHAVGAEVVYISTDAVFDGGNRPYVESDPALSDHCLRTDKNGWRIIVQTQPEIGSFGSPYCFGPGKTKFVEKRLRKIEQENSTSLRLIRKVARPTPRCGLQNHGGCRGPPLRPLPPCESGNVHSIRARQALRESADWTRQGSRCPCRSDGTPSSPAEIRGDENGRTQGGSSHCPGLGKKHLRTITTLSL